MTGSLIEISNKQFDWDMKLVETWLQMENNDKRKEMMTNKLFRIGQERDYEILIYKCEKCCKCFYKKIDKHLSNG